MSRQPPGANMLLQTSRRCLAKAIARLREDGYHLKAQELDELLEQLEIASRGLRGTRAAVGGPGRECA